MFARKRCLSPVATVLALFIIVISIIYYYFSIRLLKFTFGRRVRSIAPFGRPSIKPGNDNDSIPTAQFVGVVRAQGSGPVPSTGREIAAREEDPWLLGRRELYELV